MPKNSVEHQSRSVLMTWAEDQRDKSYLVRANICLNCDQGPYRKHVDAIDVMLPTVYMIVNGAGLPRNNCINLKVLPNERRHLLQRVNKENKAVGK